MKRLLRFLAPLALALLAASTHAESLRFSFGILASGAGLRDDAALREALMQSAEANLAFVVAQGIKGGAAPCNETIYQRRKNLFESSPHGLIVSLGAADWASCGDNASATAATAKLTQVRELFFVDDLSFGATKLPLVRQATEAKFHNFVENARWEVGSVMFATVNLPANNNHYLLAAGRNGEFEDRLVANREWLRRVFTHAGLKKLDAVVLFSEANPLIRPSGVRRDGFVETRRHIQALASRFKGKVLIVHAQPAGRTAVPAIKWRGNIGEVGVARSWLALQVDPASSRLFAPLVAERTSR